MTFSEDVSKELMQGIRAGKYDDVLAPLQIALEAAESLTEIERHLAVIAEGLVPRPPVSYEWHVIDLEPITRSFATGRRRSDTVPALDALAKSGWEVTHVTDAHVILRRELEGSAADWWLGRRLLRKLRAKQAEREREE